MKIMIQDKRFLRRLIIVVIALALIISASWWLFTHGKVVITGNYAGTVTVTGQHDQQSSSFDFNTTSKSIVLPTGQYEVRFTSKEGSFLQSIQIGRLLGTSTVTLAPQQQKDVSFVGTDPGSCGFFETVYISLECQASTASTRVHLPPSSELTPPYSRKVKSASELGSITNIFTVDDTRYAIVQAKDQRAVGRNSLYSISGSGDTAIFNKIGELASLSSERLYFGESYKKGFIAYTSSLDSAYYYESLTNLDNAQYLPSVADSDFEGLDSASGHNFKSSVVFSANNAGNSSREGDHSVVKILDGETNTRTFTFSRIIEDAQLCGEMLLCLIENNTFAVYDILDDHPTQLFKVFDSNMFTVDESTSRVYVARYGELIEFEPVSGVGFITVSFPGFSPKYLRVDKNNILFGVSNNTNSSALILKSNKVSESIFPTLSALQESGILAGISVYDKRVFLTPELTDLVYDPARDVFDYSVSEKNKANETINSIIHKNGSDTGDYRFINLLN